MADPKWRSWFCKIKRAWSHFESAILSFGWTHENKVKAEFQNSKWRTRIPKFKTGTMMKKRFTISVRMTAVHHYESTILNFGLLTNQFAAVKHWSTDVTKCADITLPTKSRPVLFWQIYPSSAVEGVKLHSAGFRPSQKSIRQKLSRKTSRRDISSSSIFHRHRFDEISRRRTQGRSIPTVHD